ncbi:MAG: RHS repeat-associated core domain-containing protein [Anaerolineae bacterium]
MPFTRCQFPDERREDIRAKALILSYPKVAAVWEKNCKNYSLISGSITSYLLDIQRTGVSTPGGLHVVLSETQGAAVTRHVHSLRGIHAHKDAGGNWEWPLQDGLGSVREVVDNSVAVLESRNYDPFGAGFGNKGTSQTAYGFTGEQTDGTGQVYLRARYYNPSIGIFTGLDPFGGIASRPMSLNGYSWVEGNSPNDAVGELIFHNRYSYANNNPVNIVDPSGMIGERPQHFASCVGFNISLPICPDPDLPFCGLTLPPDLSCPPNNPFCNFTLPEQPDCPFDTPFCTGSIPGSPLDRLTNEQLSAMCKAGKGNFNAACRELLWRCNQKIVPAVGDIGPCIARSTCDSTRHNELQRKVDLACSIPRACNSLTPCPIIFINLTLIQNCLIRRYAIVDECFQGVADDTHVNTIINEEIAYETCITEMTRTTGSGRPCAQQHLPGILV